MSHDTIPSFPDYLHARGLQPGTCRRYVDSLQRLLRHAQKPPESIQTADVVSFLTERAKGLSLGSSSYNVTFYAMVAWLQMRGLPTDLHGLGPQRHREQPPRWFLAEQVPQLFSAVYDERYRLAFAVMLGTGMRVGELCALRVKDIPRQESVIRVERGKGGDGRLVRFPDSLRVWMRSYWVKYRPQDLFFERRPPKDRRGLLPETLNARLRQAARLSGLSPMVTGSISVHRLRHTFARQMLLAGVDIVTLQKEMGHRCLESTLRYLTPDLRREVGVDFDLLDRLGVKS